MNSKKILNAGKVNEILVWVLHKINWKPINLKVNDYLFQQSNIMLVCKPTLNYLSESNWWEIYKIVWILTKSML